jgi:cephalosporin-C deacetylase-like acetyl esterase
MRFSAAAALCTLFVASSVTLAQAPPANAAGQGAARAGGANAAAAMGRPADANSPAQAGRQALYKVLDDIAAKDEAARGAEIANITTRAQAEMRQQEVRMKIQDLLGGGFTRTPLNPQVLGSTQMDGYRIEKVLYESQPKFYVTALLYLPDSRQTSGAPPLSPSSGDRVGAQLPAIVMAPGHAASGKAGDFAMAATFARNGFAVLSYDPIGQGERLQYPDPATLSKGLAAGSLATRPTGEHGEAGLQPTLIGEAVARYFLWDGMRAVDYLISRPEIDPERIGAFGCSGGGAMTALLGAMDKRVKATATACYLTTMDTLLPSIGAQDAEQSIPGFIASGFDFADWVELAAPRAYAMVGTVSDMFPWKGFLQTAQESRRFYSLFDASAAGTPTNSGAPHLASEMWVPATPTGPTLNPDTANAIPASSPFQVITGIGGHGNLRPITSQIVQYFLVHLAGKSADAYVAPPPPAPGASPFAAPNVPPGTLQVTPTGQVASSYPGCATVHTLNLKRAAGKIPQFVAPQTLQQVQTDIREVTNAEAVPGGPPSGFKGLPFPDYAAHPGPRDRIPAILLVMSDVRGTPGNPTEDDVKALSAAGNFVLGFVPTPSPPGGEETKSPILGPFYMTELRAELVDKTILGMRVDDVIHAVDYLAARLDIDAGNITVVASGHMGLVALHAAVLDPRIKHVTVDHVLESYASLLRAPMPLDAPQDILPGVLLKYDIPDLVRVLGPRLTASDWLPGTANLGGK